MKHIQTRRACCRGATSRKWSSCSRCCKCLTSAKATGNDGEKARNGILHHRFLGQPAADVDCQVCSNYDLLQRQLPGVNVDELFQERPAMLFIDPGCVPLGLQQLQEVMKTPHDTSTVSNLLWAFYGPSLEDRNGCILI